MNRIVVDVVCLASIAALAITAAIMFPGLPDPIPSHWNAAGEVDGYMPKLGGVLLLIGMPVFSLVLIKVIPYISPKGYRTDQFMGAVRFVQLLIVLFMSFVGLLVLLAASGVGIDMTTTMLAATGLLLIAVGNILGKLRKNFFIGIRTPWTLASDEVWVRTHRLGGWMTVLAGLVLVVAAFTGIKVFVTISITMALVLIPVVYSYFAYRRIEGFTPDDDDQS